MDSEETIVETPMQRLIEACDGDVDIVGDRISGVLEFLTVRAALDAPFIIYADNKESVVVIAAGDDVEAVVKDLPDHFKNWEDALDEVPTEVEAPPFDTDRDPGDEQDESATESE